MKRIFTALLFGHGENMVQALEIYWPSSKVFCLLEEY